MRDRFLILCLLLGLMPGAVGVATAGPPVLFVPPDPQLPKAEPAPAGRRVRERIAGVPGMAGHFHRLRVTAHRKFIAPLAPLAADDQAGAVLDRWLAEGTLADKLAAGGREDASDSVGAGGQYSSSVWAEGSGVYAVGVSAQVMNQAAAARFKQPSALRVSGKDQPAVRTEHCNIGRLTTLVQLRYL